MKSISTINPANVQNAQPSKQVPHLLIKIVGVSLDHDVSLCFVSSYIEQFRYHSKQRIAQEASQLTIIHVKHWSCYGWRNGTSKDKAMLIGRAQGKVAFNASDHTTVMFPKIYDMNVQSPNDSA